MTHRPAGGASGYLGGTTRALAWWARTNVRSGGRDRTLGQMHGGAVTTGTGPRCLAPARYCDVNCESVPICVHAGFAFGPQAKQVSEDVLPLVGVAALMIAAKQGDSTERVPTNVEIEQITGRRGGVLAR